MEFTLYYRGPLKANGTPKDKHELRTHFHRQLKVLWGLKPLKDHPDFCKVSPGPQGISLVKEMAGFEFVPLVSERIHLLAELDIVYLRPEPSGRIFTGGGDIDNRLKTLMDALSVPRHEEQVPKSARPGTDEIPFFCLLEDDSLVTRVGVRTDQLLESGQDPNTVVLVIRARTRATQAILGNLGLG